MKLIVSVHCSGREPLEDMEVKQFTDLDKIAARVARAVKGFLRAVPVGKSAAILDVRVSGQYVEAEPRPKPARKRKAKPEADKADAAAA